MRKNAASCFYAVREKSGGMIMELWDVYDKHRSHKGFTITRGKERLGEGEYHLTAHVCVFTNDGRMVVQRRASAKPLWPDKWDISASGSVLAGETTAKGAERELYEELGIKASLARGTAKNDSVSRELHQ